jgi:hypothetical protein
MYVIHYKKVEDGEVIPNNGDWYVLENAWGADSTFGSQALADAKIRELGLGGIDGSLAKAVKVR